MSWESELFDFHSFDFERGALSLHLSAVHLLADEREQAVEECEGQSEVRLYEAVDDVDDWQHVRIRYGIQSTSEAVIAPWLQIVCEDTRIEQNLDLSRKSSLESLECTLPVADLRGAVLLRPLGVSVKGGEPGLVGADAVGVILHLDPPPEPFGGGLRTNWGASLFRDRGIPNALTFVEFPVGEPPVLHLNSGVQDFEALLKSRATSGPIAATRQFLLDQIEAETWFALARYAAGSSYALDETQEGVECVSEDLLDDWPGGVLRKVARLCGLGGGDGSVEQVAGLLLNTEQHELVRASIQSRIGRAKGLRGRAERLAAALGKSQKEGS